MNTPKGEETIFAEALRLPPEERAAYLAKSTNGDSELRRRVESLLGSYQAGDFLEQAAAPQLRQTLQVSIPLTEKPGDTIGRYKLLQQIGEGGCGVVYMAEQSEPVRRRVALKIIKLGMDTKSVIARFEAERQALAMMDHPNIAKVFDAGATETGRPYFVMELVRGMKITDYCDGAKLSTRARLDLFIQVCQAIQHAHQKGIIHRDIKPSNILVTVNDGVAVPKVIDFGVAKATGGLKLTNKTVFTAFEQFIGTPAYMSPEQAVLTSLDIDTRSDIYALGVLLYEILTGQTPFDTKELLAIGLDEMRRTIREKEPDRPSTRVSTLPGQALSTTAQRRGLEAPKLVSELRGDLDWIVMKCLEKDRARRYETANGLASDIERHLNNEPVVACPPGRLYRFQKMVRRNKLTFAAGSAVAASLVIGLGVSTVLFFRERAARERADEQTAIAEAVNDFLQKDLLQQASSYAQSEANFIPDPNLTVRTALERATERIGDRFKDQPLQEAAVRTTIGEALLEVGEAKQAVAALERAVELRRAELGPNDRDTLSSMGSLGNAYRVVGKRDQARNLLEETLERQERVLGPDDPDTLRSMGYLGALYEDPNQALPLLEETVKRRTARLGPHDRKTLRSMGMLGTANMRFDKLDQAVPLLEETLELKKTYLGSSDLDTVQTMQNLAGAYFKAGKVDQAVEMFQKVLELRQAALGPTNPETLVSMYDLACAYGKAGKGDLALPLFEDTLKRMTAMLGRERPETLQTMIGLGIAYTVAGKFDQALPLMEDAVNLEKATQGTNASLTWAGMQTLSSVYLNAHKPEQAVAVRAEMLEIARAKYGLEHQETLGSMDQLAIAYAEAGQIDQAADLRRGAETHEGRTGPGQSEDPERDAQPSDRLSRGWQAG